MWPTEAHCGPVWPLWVILALYCVCDDATLEAIAAGTLDMLAMCRQVADEIHQAA